MCVYNIYNPEDGLLLKPINISVELTLFQICYFRKTDATSSLIFLKLTLFQI